MWYERRLRRVTLSEPRPYKKHTKKKTGVYTAKWEWNYIHGLFTFASVVQILDYVDKNHMNSHYFHCSHWNKLKKLWRNTNRRLEYSSWVYFMQQDKLVSHLSSFLNLFESLKELRNRILRTIRVWSLFCLIDFM